MRLTGSMYKTDKALSNTLYGGDRAGSRYYYVLENTAATETAQKDSGLINPGFKNKVTAMQVNPFVKFRGPGSVRRHRAGQGQGLDRDDRARRGSSTRWTRSTASWPNEKLFVGVRYNRRRARWPASPATSAPTAGRSAAAGSSRPNVLMKAEYVNQKYFGYPATNIKNGGQFKGMMLEGVVAF